jgi:hypothetical protein
MAKRMLAKDDKRALAGIAGIILAWLILLAITLGSTGCGTMAPIVKQIPNAPADFETNRYVVNPIYSAPAAVAKNAPIPYVPQAVAILTSLLAIGVIAKNRKLRKTQQQRKEEQE